MSGFLNIKIYEVLNQYWGYDSFRQNQSEIIHSILSDNDTISLIPTGGGKSLCFQLPALVKDGCCIVISPLIALINDQVQRLKSLNIPAEGLHSGLEQNTKDDILLRLVDGELKLLYISPERLQSQSFRKILKNVKISFIAVDEAHCISQWGYDFRPEYRKISNIKDIFPNIKIAAFTATANKKTLKDIKTYLGINKAKIFKGSFYKENIRFAAINTEKKLKVLKLLLSQLNGSGIIYMRSRKGTEKLNQLLRNDGFSTGYYHAGLNSGMRNKIQGKWLENDIQVIISTTAFGMGIDKPDVRFVLHYDLPASMEEYYQEAGRAGRDGQVSDAVIIYNSKDLNQLRINSLEYFPTLESIKVVYNSLLRYFDIANMESGKSFEFDIHRFLKHSGLASRLVFNSLSELERFGYISFNYSTRYAYSHLKINMSDEDLREMKKENSIDFKVLSSAIHLYEDLFSINSPIDEKMIARSCGLDIDVVKQSLIRLNAERKVIYKPDFSNIFIVFNKTDELNINIGELKYRKDKLEKNIKSVEKYLNQNKCRQFFILEYFDEKLKKSCGICDNCYNRINSKYSDKEFSDFYKKIINFEFNKSTGLEELAFSGFYMDRKKNKSMLKKMIQSGDLKIEGDKIKKANG